MTQSFSEIEHHKGIFWRPWEGCLEDHQHTSDSTFRLYDYRKRIFVLVALWHIQFGDYGDITRCTTFYELKKDILCNSTIVLSTLQGFHNLWSICNSSCYFTIFFILFFIFYTPLSMLILKDQILYVEINSHLDGNTL